MSENINFIWDKLVNRVDDLLIQENYRNDYQIKFSESEIDVSKSWDDNELSIFVSKDGKTTSTTIASSNLSSIDKTLETMLKVLEKISKNPLYNGMAEGKFQYQNIETIFDNKFDNFILEAPEIVNQAVENCLQSGAKRAAGILFFGKENISFKSSRGPSGSFAHSYWEFNCRGLQEDTDSTGFGQNSGAIPSSASELIMQSGEEAGMFSKKMIGAKLGKPGIYDLILAPATGGQVMAALPAMANPLMILFGMSGLNDRMGDQLAPDYITVTDEGPRDDCMVSKPFDAEGYPTQITPIIEKGILINLVHNTSSAKLYQTDSTGNSFLKSISSGTKMITPDNHTRVFSGGNHTFDELAESDSSNPLLYATNSWYLRYTNSIEGIFSVIPRDGLFLIENGEYKPVKKLRISDDLYRIMKNIQGMEKDIERKQVKWWDEVSPPVILSHMKISDCQLSSATK